MKLPCKNRPTQPTSLPFGGEDENHLGLRQRSRPFALLRQEEADGHEELLDAAAELLLALAAGGEGKQPPRLDYVLENVLLCLQGQL